MRDLCDGFFYKEHPIFTADPLALQVILYYDDIEVANPLGAKAGYHKLSKTYKYIKEHCEHTSFLLYM